MGQAGGGRVQRVRGHHRLRRERVQGKGKWRLASWRRKLQTTTGVMPNPPPPPPPVRVVDGGGGSPLLQWLSAVLMDPRRWWYISSFKRGRRGGVAVDIAWACLSIPVPGLAVLMSRWDATGAPKDHAEGP